MYSQRAASAWQGAQPQKLTVSMLLPGTSSAAEWRDLLQSRRQFWPTLTTRHASLVPVSAEALQRERRQMQAKHLWYNVDIRWIDLKDKLEVLVPTGLTRDDIWRHLFLTKQHKNPYEEGCYTGEDVEDVKQKWEAKKHYFAQYKKDGCRPPTIDLDTAIQGFNIDNTAAYQATEDSKALHARPWQTKEGMYRIKRRALPDVRDAPLLTVNLARFTKTRDCISCFGSMACGFSPSPGFVLLRALHPGTVHFNFRTAFPVTCWLFPPHPPSFPSLPCT